MPVNHDFVVRYAQILAEEPQKTATSLHVTGVVLFGRKYPDDKFFTDEALVKLGMNAVCRQVYAYVRDHQDDFGH